MICRRALLLTPLLATAALHAQEAGSGSEPRRWLAEAVVEAARARDDDVVLDPAVLDEVTLVDRPEVPPVERLPLLLRAHRADLADLPGGVALFTRPPRVALAARDAPAERVAVDLAAQAGQCVAVAPSLEARVDLELGDADWRRAIDLLARAVGAHVSAGEGWLLLAPEPLALADPAADAGPTVSVEAVLAPLGEVAASIAEAAGVRVDVDPRLSRAPVTAWLGEVPWRRALEALARPLGARLRRGADGWSLAPPPRLVLHAVDAPPGALLDLLAEAAGTPLTVDPTVDGPLTLHLEGLDAREALGVATASAGLPLQAPDDGLRVGPRPASAAWAAPPEELPPVDPARIQELLRAVTRHARLGQGPQLRGASAELQAMVTPHLLREAAARRAEAERLARIEAAADRLLTEAADAGRADALDAADALDRLGDLLEGADPAALARYREVLARHGARLARSAPLVYRSLRVHAAHVQTQRLLDDVEAALVRGAVEEARAAQAALELVLIGLADARDPMLVSRVDAARERLGELTPRVAALAPLAGVPLRAQAVLVPDPSAADPRPVALLDGRAVRVGDAVVDPASGEPIPGLEVRAIELTEVRLALGEHEVRRPVDAE